MGILTKKNGRLRTFWIAFCLFSVLLLVSVMLFKVSKPVEHVLVAVRHVFEPLETEKKPPAVKKPVEEKQKQTPEKRVEDRETAKQEETPVVAAQASESKKMTAHKTETPEQDETKKESSERNTKKKRSKDSKAASAPISTPVLAKRKVEPKVAHAEVPDRHIGDETRVSVEEDEKIEDLDEERLEVNSKNVKSNAKQRSMQTALLDKSSIENLSLEGTEKKLRKENSDILLDPVSLDKLNKPPKAVKSDSSPAPRLNVSRHMTSMTSSKSLDKRRTLRRNTPNQSKSKRIQANAEEGEITVDKDQYVQLFKSWQSTGNRSEDLKKIPLRVENLRQTYELFQMKPVAVVGKDVFIDLADGTRIPEKSLDEYSGTVFLVNDPWIKWGGALAEAGIREEERVEVRYYMYPFIKDAIYGRVNHAFSWVKEQNLLSSDMSEASVDVLGRAYVIKQKGGGRFGVFVPVSLDTCDGRVITISPRCFVGEKDVDTLVSAGVL